MKSKFSVVLFAAIIMLTACQSPANTVYVTGTALHTSNQLMIAAYKAGRIDQNVLKHYGEASKVARLALERFEAARLAGDTANLQTLSDAAKVEIAKAVVIRLNALEEK